jgi:hypothetical protein
MNNKYYLQPQSDESALDYKFKKELLEAFEKRKKYTQSFEDFIMECMCIKTYRNIMNWREKQYWGKDAFVYKESELDVLNIAKELMKYEKVS